MDAVNLHPPIIDPKIVSADVDGGYLINIAATIRLLKEGETERARMVYRRYVAKYRAMAGQHLSHKEREKQAFFAAWNEVAREVGMDHLVK